MDLTEERGEHWSRTRRPEFRIANCIFPIGANRRERRGEGDYFFFSLLLFPLLGIFRTDNVSVGARVSGSELCPISSGFRAL
jgi:hypothetical protein